MQVFATYSLIHVPWTSITNLQSKLILVVICAVD